jgi:hypothetical protein
VGNSDADELRFEAGLAGLEWLDSVVKTVMQAPGGIRDRLLMTVVLSGHGRDLTHGLAGPAAAGGLQQSRDALHEVRKAAEASGTTAPREVSAAASKIIRGI